MGVIAPEHKKKHHDNRFSLFIFLLIVIGVPFLAIRSCASHAVMPVTVEVNGRSVHSNSAQYTKDKKGLYELTGPVMDVAGVLSSGEYAELDSFLRNLERNSGVQIVVLTVKSLGGDSIEEFSINHAQKWQLGYKGVDNGALLTVAMAEHDVRIETGYGTEGTLTDAKCARIIRNVIIPAFRSNDYAEGIIEGVKNMAGIITGDESLLSPSVNQSTNDVYVDSEEDPLELLFAFVIVVVVVIFSVSVNGGRRGYRRRRRHGGIYVFPGSFGSSSHSRHSSGNFGGGSSFHGGGGSFGGGGASGHW